MNNIISANKEIAVNGLEFLVVDGLYYITIESYASFSNINIEIIENRFRIIENPSINVYNQNEKMFGYTIYIKNGVDIIKQRIITPKVFAVWCISDNILLVDDWLETGVTTYFRTLQKIDTNDISDILKITPRTIINVL